MFLYLIFVSSEIFEIQIEEEFLNKIAKLDKNVDYYGARKNSLEIQKKQELNAVFSLKKKKKKSIKNYNKRHG